MKVTSYSPWILPKDLVTINLDELVTKNPVSELHKNPDYVSIARSHDLTSFSLRRAGTWSLRERRYEDPTQSLYVNENGEDGALVFFIDPPRKQVVVNKSEQRHLRVADEVFLLVTGVSLGALCKDYDKEVEQKKSQSS